jgi:YVTN family beta-propeller protein
MNREVKENFSKPLFAYVANLFGSSVSVIDIKTFKVIDTLPVREYPWDVAITPDGRRAYITTGILTFEITDFIEVINTKNNTVIDEIPLGSEVLRADPVDISITPDGRHAYISNFASSNVTVIDTRTNTVRDTITAASFLNPQGVVITPDGKLVYITNYENKSISVICTKTNSVIDTIEVGEGPDGIVISPDGRYAYVANDFASSEGVPGTVSVIDTGKNRVIDTIPVGNFAVGIAITPDGKLVFVTNLLDNTVSVIDTGKNKVIKTISVGDGPIGVAITPLCRR